MFQTSFELGIFNAWILLLIYFIVSIIPFFFIKNKIAPSKKMKEISPSNVNSDIYSKILYWLLFIIFILSLLVSFFIPLKINSIWFYIGVIIFSIGVILVLFVINSWTNSTSDKPITHGIYRYSRHPMYISMMFSYIGISIAAISWVFLMVTLIHIFLTILFVESEEEFLIKKYKDEYKNYMEKTPRWIGITKK